MTSKSKDENRNGEIRNSRAIFRASIFEFQSLLAHHSSLITHHCALLAALCLLTCSSLACRRPSPLTPYTAYVVNHQSATLAAVNLADFHVTASLPVSPQPERVLVRPGARQLYVVSATGKISVAAFPHLHLVTTLDVGRSAKDLAFSPDGRAAYVLNPADHEVVFLDCEGGAGNPPEGAIPKVAFRLRLAGTLVRPRPLPRRKNSGGRFSKP